MVWSCDARATLAEVRIITSIRVAGFRYGPRCQDRAILADQNLRYDPHRRQADPRDSDGPITRRQRGEARGR